MAIDRCLQERQIDGIIHLAAESHVDRSIVGPRRFVETNVVGTFNLLQAARRRTASGGRFRFLHVSTDEVFGSLGETGYFNEHSPYRPSSPYSASKAAGDHLVHAYHATYGLDTVVSNCSNNYGPYQFPEKLIPLMIHNALHREKLPVYGDGSQVRDWLHVQDHCRALELIYGRGQSGWQYVVGGHNEIRNIELVRTILKTVAELTGQEAREDLIEMVIDRPGHDRRYAIDASRIDRELGWKPTYRFEEGLRQTVAWYLENQEWVRQSLSGENRRQEQF